MGSGTIILVAFVSLLVGYGAGLILTRMSNPKPKKDAASEPAGVGSRLELLKMQVLLWRKDEKSPIHADVFGKTVNSPEELTPAEKSRLTRELQAVHAWFGLAKPAVPVVPPLNEQAIPLPVGSAQVEVLPVEESSAQTEPGEPLVMTQPGEIPHIEPPAEVVNSPQSLPPIHLTPVYEDTSEEPVKPVEVKLDLRGKPKPAPVMKSIVQQIDDILQEKVARSSLAETGIKLQESPQGVLVWVGNQSYLGVDTLPEGDAKALIHAAVKEWEKRG